jgi:uncharacterized membrane protein
VPAKIVLAAFFILAGVLHFLTPIPFIRIVPPMLPWPQALVAISGAAEILGGFALLLSVTQRHAAYGLVLLLIAVFPANIYMAMTHIPFPGVIGQSWFQWLRLPVQFLLIAWVWRYTRLR